ncbi:MAG: hypothetical protein IJ719_21335 [Clostridia bacterium]|nr:hypothetical protein [Clostridia bacterium]
MTAKLQKEYVTDLKDRKLRIKRGMTADQKEGDRMYVMMDVEWMLGNPDRITQIAGIRFDEHYQIHGSFFERIAPKSGAQIDWGQVCFNGGSRRDFLNGRKVRDVYQMLDTWLDAKDVLLWWNQDGMIHFKQCEKYMEMHLPNRACVIGDQVRRCFRGREFKKANPYTLCKARSIPCPEPMHHSYNDAMTIINLLRGMHLQVSKIAYSTKPKQKEKAKFVMLEDGLVHRADCPKCTGQQVKVPYYSINECLTEKACSCCAKAKAEAIREKENAFLFSAKGKEKIVHFPDCRDAARIDEANLSAFRTLNDAKQCGYRLCKTCCSIERMVSRQKEELERYAAQNALTFKVESGLMTVISRRDEWIIRIEEETGKLRLYHRSSGGHRKEETDLSDYHLQKWYEKTSLEYFEYIAKHDEYDENRDKEMRKNVESRDNETRRNDETHKMKRKQKYKRTRVSYDDFEDDDFDDDDSMDALP